MKLKLLLTISLTLCCLALVVAYNATSRVSAKTAAAFDGTTPPHAVDTDGKTIPESSATQPDKPILLSRDISNNKDPENKYCELLPAAAFDHAKHNTDPMHTLDGKTLTTCVHCHHTEQPSASGGETYLKTFKRTKPLTADHKNSDEPVKSCRACHFQPSTAAIDEYPPKMVKYPRELWKQLGRDSGPLTNDGAYHGRCISCHAQAMERDPKLKAPKGCPECHIQKSTTGICSTPAPSPTPTPTP